MQIRRRVIDAWLHDLRVGWGDRAERSATTISAVIACAEINDLHTIGYHFATEGHPLDEVLAWLDLLASRSRCLRQALVGGGIEQLASGWAEGVLRSDAAEEVIPFEVLRLRLRQQVQRGHVFGQSPSTHLALVVIETDGSAASTSRVARHAREAFHTGETMAATPSGKLIILVRRDHDVHERAAQVTNAVRSDSALAGTPVRVWIEPLAMSADHVDSHLLGLVS